jgi:hypothetical protein
MRFSLTGVVGAALVAKEGPVLKRLLKKGVPQGLKPYFLWRFDHTAEAVCLRELLRKPLDVAV